MRSINGALSRAGSESGAHEVTLRLKPAALGQVRVRVAYDESTRGLSARFEVTSVEARKLVDQSLGHLRRSLESRGLGIGELDVQLSPRAPVGADPLGLAIGTPYAEGHGHDGDPTAHAGAANGAQPDGRGTGSQSHSPDGGGGERGPEARERAQVEVAGSTDASLGFEESDAAAERLLGPLMRQVSHLVARDSGGAARLMIDAVA